MSGMMADIAQQRIEQDRKIADNQHKLHEQSSTLIDSLGEKSKS